MEKILFVIVVLFIFSCGDDTKKNPCDGITCESYETCDEGVCALNSGSCESDNDCKEADKTICDLDTHLCEEAESNCIGLSISGPQYYKNIYAGGGYYVSYEETIEEGLYFSLEFYEATPTGDYDLMSTGINDNYETCMQCVLIYDLRAENEEDHSYSVQTAGTLKVTSGDAYLENAVGSISNIKLQEAIIDWDDTSHSTLVDGGDCYEIEFASWSNEAK